jgi:hypothetical protein
VLSADARERARAQLLRNVRTPVQTSVRANTVSRQSDMHGLLRPGEIARLTEVAIKFDRLLRGESTENVATAASVDLSGLSLDELRALSEIQRKIGPREGTGPEGR